MHVLHAPFLVVCIGRFNVRRLKIPRDPTSAKNTYWINCTNKLRTNNLNSLANLVRQSVFQPPVSAIVSEIDSWMHIKIKISFKSQY
jgi:hypothetical protein